MKVAGVESLPAQTCDLVLKGGVTSGLVYGPMLGKLAQTYRFQGLAGASAGAMAAALAAAAEYARQRGDATAFAQLTRLCQALPEHLTKLFQASPPFRALLKAVIYLAPGSFKPRWLRAIACFWQPLLAGAGLFLLIMAGIYAAMGLGPLNPAALPALGLSAVTGAVAGLALYLVQRVQLAARRYNFGICSGLSAPGRPEAVTNWLHDAVQTLSGQASPLTFGDLRDAGIDLRVVTTNLSLCRTHMLPDFDLDLWFDPEDWRRLFPPPVMAQLRAFQSDPAAALWRMPDRDRMPVIVAVRMSLACPALMEQVPVYAEALAGPNPAKRLYLSDGGVALNFPFDVFSQTDKTHPTFAIDLCALYAGADPSVRVWPVAEEVRQVRPHFDVITGPFGFVWALCCAMREAQNRAAMRVPHPAHHVFRVALKRSEGGMNIDMSGAQIDDLMALGEDAANHIVMSNRAETP